MFKKIVLTLLNFEASLVLKRHKPVVIGITGNVGKTSTKEAIAGLLLHHYAVAKSPKSYNSAIGLPLAILGLHSAWRSTTGWTKNIARGFWRVISRGEYPEMLVLEMGVDRPGDMDELVRLVRPHIAVVSAIGATPVHVEFFGSAGALADEKAKLISSLDAEGIAILNADDPLVVSMASRAQGKIITYGFSHNATLRASGYKLLLKSGRPVGMAFKIDHDGKTMPIKVSGVFGKHHVYALLAAAAVGAALGLNLIEIAEGFADFHPPKGRFNIIDGANDSLIIDDSYNASPLAVEAALETLQLLEAKRKIAVLGDMLELGKFAADAHRAIGRIAAKKANVIVAVGLRAKYMEEARAREFHWFANSDQAAGFLKEYIRAGDLVLVKGSQGARMEKIVHALMAEPERAHDLLVRQEAYWKGH